ncbi:glycosyltransferase family protein [Adhaeribacter radiodurans]|uniref:CDP-glycerol glycerophosphotransferase family protein n=1 Tax=Adhaeribacter radiodurans TaxID=2745197 RepID=A0A7L7L8C4_9BACT|nr:hypothetical protein [Adhaeribacter radiodurans]QMU28984.1 hypothetical protein HUW48_13455 [Adhaeribacter radiodurans]
MRYSKLVHIYADILQLRFTDTFAAIPAHAINAISPVNVFARLGRVLLYTGGRLFLDLFLPFRNKENISGKVWLYVVSKNNYESLQFIKVALPEAVFVAGQNKQIGIYNKQVTRLPTRFKIFYYYKFIPLLLGLYQLKGKRALRFFDLIYTAVGYYELSLKYLQKYRPIAIIFANDHNTDPRALLIAAKEVGIPTIYLQHASVSTNFPPLSFDLSLLEGQDSLDKYRACGPVLGEVKLIGMPKADKYLANKNSSTTIESIGVCANIIDETDRIKELLTRLVQEFPDKKISFRPHPSDRRNFNFINQISPGIQFSNAKVEPAFDFLQKQDVIIAADSSIHLEAVMLNILSIYYRLEKSNFVDDYYGYVRHQLVEKAADLNDLTFLISSYELNRPQVSGRAKYYNAVMGTELEGRSHELALRYIKEYLLKSGKA